MLDCASHHNGLCQSLFGLCHPHARLCLILYFASSAGLRYEASPAGLLSLCHRWLSGLHQVVQVVNQPLHESSLLDFPSLCIRWLFSHPQAAQVVNQPPHEAIPGELFPEARPAGLQNSRNPLKSPPGLLHKASPAGLQNLFIRWLINHPLKPALLNFSMKLALSDFKISASGG